MTPRPTGRPLTRRAVLAGLGAALVTAGCAARPGKDDAPSPTPAPTPTAFAHPWGPGPEEVAAATRAAAAMSPEEVAGQVIVGRLHGTDPREAADLVSELHLAGVMITGSSVASLEQVRALSAGVHAAVAADGRDWPGLVSTDNEGGAVQRMSGADGPWTTFPPFAVAGRAPADVVTTAYAAMARELRASGLTVDWAPVADVTVPDQDVTIGSRSAGTDPARVSGTVVAAMEGFLDGAVLPAVKHFPGHGALTTDSHEALPVQDATAAELRAHDLPPFRAAVDAGVPMVMLGHVDVTAWDPGVPASVSPAAYRVLREDLGFSGVAVTDSLGMGALGAVGGPGEVAVAALEAGADLLLNPADNAAAQAAVVAAIKDGTLDRARVDEAAGRVIALLRHQDALAAAAGPVGPEDVGGAAPAAAALRAAGEAAG
ncbi:glycoside hydrolase family 3 N-terminal domain-containing protein [Georgenia thermotolerans]|uniref:beta-N-acetylhexosaminidase n=1 Tax=Georgenia thermotolerans TaxID=527326 RepID=A0A7J5UJV5_9MICO|nr:glycoside hydrolase family 3 N-terminal domain-containing protein [Georgenia thermotolerans]KAE8762679.1 glycosyl hyrolase family 3 [Georgenia thermotolerans]